MRDLLKKMEDRFSSKETTMRDSTRKYLQRNLENFNIIKFQNTEGKLYVYSTSLTTEQLVVLYINTKTELDRLKKIDGNDYINLIRNRAKSIRKEIMQLQDSLPWPPQPKDLEPEKFTLPNKLNLMIKSLLNYKDEQPSRTDRLRYSLGQDIIYAATKGRVRSSKNILVPSMVKTHTNNTELINILNRLGHGVSYSLLMEAQTENAFQILDEQVVFGCIIPKECQPDTFSIYVADNIDRNKETLSGMNKSNLFLTLAIRSKLFSGQSTV